MRFMMMVKATPASEAGTMPTPAQIAEMGAYNDQLSKAGVLVDLAGLHPTSRGARIRFAGGERILTNGPFDGGGQIVSGYWIIDVKSAEEALEWAMRAPDPAFGSGHGEIELRRFFAPSDFEPATPSS